MFAILMFPTVSLDVRQSFQVHFASDISSSMWAHLDVLVVDVTDLLGARHCLPGALDVRLCLLRFTLASDMAFVEVLDVRLGLLDVRCPCRRI